MYKFSSQWKQKQRATSKTPNTQGLGLLQFHCFIHRYCLVVTQVFRHFFTPGEVLPYWPVWDLKGRRDPRISPLVMSFIHNEDDFLSHLATQHMKWTSWEQGSCFLTSSHGAPGSEHQWFLTIIRGIPKQHQSKKSLVKRKNVLLKNKNKHSVWWEAFHTVIAGLS